jgi:hypothetical protein
MSLELAAASYRRDLGDGLTLRWSSAGDAEGVAQLMGMTWRDRAEAPINPRMVEVVRRHMSGGFPLVGPGDCALVEATQQPGRPIVAFAFLWRGEWSYEGIRFAIGQPENVATDPAYRNRGLVRAIVELIHARSSAEGHLVQAITGIPTFYRQFGYEYALDLHGGRIAYAALIPPAPEAAPEPYALRAAELADVPLIAKLYARGRADSVVWNEIPERYWRYLVEVWGPPDAPLDPLLIGVAERLLTIVDTNGAACGYAMVAAKRWGADLPVYSVEFAPEISLAAAAPPLLRALLRYGEQLPLVAASPQPLREISLSLGRAHPLNTVLAPTIAPVVEPPYAWYLRVPDLPAFLQLIAPALERRLTHSPAAGYSGTLTLNFYRDGLRLQFEAGRLVAIEPWRASAYQNAVDASLPALVFLQLVFGYRSLADLRYAFPDVGAGGAGELLLNALFPARPSWVISL